MNIKNVVPRILQNYIMIAFIERRTLLIVTSTPQCKGNGEDIEENIICGCILEKKTMRYTQYTLL